ncbi:hypothetical protein [Rhodopila sp.]|uniref:hypothetical protein n=1 Tax=Rhodopila sp. TaxID=2480087 RepID=UPI003D0991DA
MAEYNLVSPYAYWYSYGVWDNLTSGQYGQPGLYDTALIQNGVPYVYGAYLDGPLILIQNANANANVGVAFYNTAIGSDTSIFINASVGTPQIIFSDSVLYGNLYAQNGSTTLSISSNTYGVIVGTTVVGGDYSPYSGYYQATLTVAENGAFSNYGQMYSEGGGNLSFSIGQQTLSNYGGISAYGGLITVGNSPAGNFDNEGALVAGGNGTITVNSALTVGQRGVVAVDSGTFILGGPMGGSGTLDLNAGNMTFLNASAMGISSTVTTKFSGSSFTLTFDGATSLSDLLQSPTGQGGHDNLIIGAYFGGTGKVQLMDLALDTSHTYAASNFTTQGNQLLFAHA